MSSMTAAWFRLIKGHGSGRGILIHGRGARVQNLSCDWTQGCAVVTDSDMAGILGPVRPGTPIFSKP